MNSMKKGELTVIPLKKASRPLTSINGFERKRLYVCRFQDESVKVTGFPVSQVSQATENKEFGF
jgi:hypothetical protein